MRATFPFKLESTSTQNHMLVCIYMNRCLDGTCQGGICVSKLAVLCTTNIWWFAIGSKHHNTEVIGNCTILQIACSTWVFFFINESVLENATIRYEVKKILLFHYTHMYVKDTLHGTTLIGMLYEKYLKTSLVFLTTLVTAFVSCVCGIAKRYTHYGTTYCLRLSWVISCHALYRPPNQKLPCKLVLRIFWSLPDPRICLFNHSFFTY